MPVSNFKDECLVPLVYCGGYRNLEIEAYSERTSDDYEPLMNAFSRAGFEPHVLRPEWDDRESGGPEVWAEDMVDALIDHARPGKPIIAAGFSCGGLLAYIASQKIGESKDPLLASLDIRVLAASPSPWSRPMIDGAWSNPKSEVRTMMPEWLQHDFLNLRLKYPTTVPAQFYVGGTEHYRVKAMHKLLAETALDPTVIRMARVGHDILDPRYIQTIANNIGELATVEVASQEDRENHRALFSRFAMAESTLVFGEPIFSNMEDGVQYDPSMVVGQNTLTSYSRIIL